MDRIRKLSCRRPLAGAMVCGLLAVLIVAASGAFAGAAPTRQRSPTERRAVAAPTATVQVAEPAGDGNSARGVVPRALENLAPARLVIPKLGLDAPILALGPDPKGAMQAPRVGGPTNPIWSEVYWWDVGALPGQTGNAVIAGHVNRPDASPSTFTHLDWLIPGDMMQIVTAGGRTLTFRVTAKDAPLVYVHGGNDPTVERIFGPALTPNLNLMTCWGEWDGTDYNRRLVVYSTLVGLSPFPQQPGEVVVH